jgi:hypothetical protein
MVHRLVVMAFIGPIPDGLQVNHKDGNKTNNSISNLEIVTQAENMRHAVLHGLRPSGSRHCFAKLNESQVRKIRDLRTSGMGPKAISDLFGVSSSNISNICAGRIWRTA